MAVFFNGRKLITPTTASAVNDDAMQSRNLTVGNAVAYVGKALGGTPGTVMAFGNPEQARKILRGGELLDAVLKAFDPSADTGAPATVHAVRVNPATQAQIVLKGDGADSIRIVSRNYGLRDNLIAIRIENGSLSGKRITVQCGNDYAASDNIGREAFSLRSTGDGQVARISIGDALVTLNVDGSSVAEIDLSEFSTIGSVVDRIASVSGFSATILGRSDSLASLRGLDPLTDVVIGSGLTVRADLQALVDWLNGENQSFVSAERLNGAGVPENVGLTWLTGGSDGNTTIADWYKAFSVLQTKDVQWITPISPDPAIHAMADTHVAFCSGTLRRERRALCGTGLNTSDTEALMAAKFLNSDRTSLIHIGTYDYDTTGKLVLFPAYMTAALAAAAFAGVSPGTALTNKSFKARGLERELLNPTETDPLIEGGVFCVEMTDDGCKFVQSISTWLGSRRYNKVEQSCGTALDYTVRSVREAVDVLRGQKGNPLLLSRAVSIAEGVLRELARAEPQGPGVLAGDSRSPAYRNITATLEGDVTRIQFECSPVIPANYILVTVYAVPYSGSVTA